jgi:hypothetical protein
MPSLDVSELNIVIAVLGMLLGRLVRSLTHKITGAFIVGYGFLSVKIKQVWYLGEARTFKLVMSNSSVD